MSSYFDKTNCWDSSLLLKLMNYSGSTELKIEEGYSADIYPWRGLCPYYLRQTSREGYMSFSRWPHTHAVSYCKKPEQRRFVVDGEERVEECICVRGHLEKTIYPSRDVWRTLCGNSADIETAHQSLLSGFDFTGF